MAAAAGKPMAAAGKPVAGKPVATAGKPVAGAAGTVVSQNFPQKKMVAEHDD